MIFQQPKVISASTLKVQSTSGIMPELILLTPLGPSYAVLDAPRLLLPHACTQHPAACTALKQLAHPSRWMEHAEWPVEAPGMNAGRAALHEPISQLRAQSLHGQTQSLTLRRMTE